jgi:uncharacterized 2Fe-2S/4Fe-4S cluster protein (DUF4445 family)
MQMQDKKLQTDEKQLILRSCLVAECDTTSKNILNKEIREYVVVHIQVAELAYIGREQTKIFLGPPPHFLLEG